LTYVLFVPGVTSRGSPLTIVLSDAAVPPV
jgi:hypothetical protein